MAFATDPRALALNNQGADLFGQGKFLEAKALFEEVASRVTLLEDRIMIELQLAKVAEACSNLVEAGRRFKDAVVLCKSLGLGHPLMGKALQRWGRVWVKQGFYAQADTLLKQALDLQESTLGPVHEDVATTLVVMGESSLHQGNFRLAKGQLRRAVAIAEQHVTDQYPDDLCAALHALQQVYAHDGDFDDAEPLAARVLSYTEQFKGPNHPFTAGALTNMCHLTMSERKNLPKAQELLQRVLSIVLQYPNQEEIATTWFNLGRVQFLQGDVVQAQPCFEQALCIQQRVLGHHVNVAHTLHALAKCALRSKQLDRAVDYYQQALVIYNSMDRTHPATSAIYMELAKFLPDQLATQFKARAATAATAAKHESCGACGKMEVHKGNKCSRCKVVWYCNSECQQQAWPAHKGHCHAPPPLPPKFNGH